MTAQQTPDSEACALDRTMHLKGFDGVARTGGVMPAMTVATIDDPK
jgi:hypothetical protein